MHPRATRPSFRSFRHSSLFLLLLLLVPALAYAAPRQQPEDVAATAGATSQAQQGGQAMVRRPLRAPALRYQRSALDPASSITSAVDVTFAIDNTGSMCGTIDTVKSDVRSIANAIRATVPDTTFGAIRFRDYGDAFITQILAHPTDNITTFSTAINAMYCDGGDDTPEAYVETVFQGVNEVYWRSNALHLFVVIGDAPPHDPIYGTGVSGSGFTWAQAASAANNAGMVVSMVAVGYGVGDDTVYASYTYMANATKGLYIESSDPTEVSNALIDLISSLSAGMPTVTATYPGRDALNVALDTVITATFNMDMAPSTINHLTVVLDQGSYCPPFSVTYDGATRTVSITPKALEPNRTYTVVLGNGLAAASGRQLSTYQWSFSTPGVTPYDRVVNKLNVVRSASKDTLDAYGQLLAGYAYDGFQALSADQQVDMTLFLADLAFEGVIGAGEKKLFGPGTKGITAGLRAAIEAARGVDDGLTVWEDFRIFVDGEHWRGLSSIGPRYAWNQAPTWDQCYDFFNEQYGFYGPDPGSVPYAYGLLGVEAEVDAKIEAAIASVPADISAARADEIAAVLDTLVTQLMDARSAEIVVSFVDGGTARTVDLGQLTTWSEMLNWGIKWMPAEESAKATATLVRAVGAVMKVGGLGTSWTGLGLGFVAWGDIMIWGSTATELAWDTFAGVELSPVETIKYAVEESAAALNYEVQFHLAVLDNAMDAVSAHTPVSRSPNVTSGAVVAPSATDPLVVGGVSVPPIDTAAGSTAAASITVQNVSGARYGVAVVGALLGPASPDKGRAVIAVFSRGDLVDIPAGATARVEFRFASPSTLVVGPEGLAMKIDLIAVNRDTGASIRLGPYVRRVLAGSSDEIKYSTQTSVADLLTGTVTAGQRQEVQVSLPAGQRSVSFLLTVRNGADADIHLYDPEGHHVGVNYASAAVETDIDGATFFGSGAKGQEIRLDAPASGVYVLRVVGRSGSAPFTVVKTVVPKLASMLAVDPKLDATGLPGETSTLTLTLREVGGSSDVTAVQVTLAGALADGAGHTIPAAQVVFGSYAATVAKGQAIAVPVNITIPGAAVPGAYTGTISIASSAGTRKVPLTVVVELDESTAAISVSAITPNHGPTAGGQMLTIAGSGFLTGVTGVTIGGRAAAKMKVVNDSEMRMVTPAGKPGAADVAILVSGAARTVPDGFTYDAEATVAPDLQLTMTHSGNFTVGVVAVYTLTITNVGQGATTGEIVVRDNLPTGITYTGNSAGWSCVAVRGRGAVCRNPGPLASGGLLTLQLAVAVDSRAVGTITNVAEVATPGERNESDNRAADKTTVKAAPELARPGPEPGRSSESEATGKKRGLPTEPRSKVEQVQPSSSASPVPADDRGADLAGSTTAGGSRPGPVGTMSTERTAASRVALPADTGSLEGVVYDTLGRPPAAPVTVVVFPQDSTQWFPASPFVRTAMVAPQPEPADDLVVTGDRGARASVATLRSTPAVAVLSPAAFVIAHLSEGRYWVATYEDPGDAPAATDRQTLEHLKAGAVAVTVRAGETSRVSLVLAK